MCSDFYLYGSSNGLEEVRFDLPHELKSGKWQIGLCEISYMKHKTVFPSLDVMCDLIIPNFKNAKSTQILRRIPQGRGDISIRFNPIFYCDVITSTIKSLTVYLSSDSKSENAFTNTKVYWTLQLHRDD
jgi:hypothetical protein